jgi:hypothetical protein
VRMRTSQTKTYDKFCNHDFSIVSFLNVSIKGGCWNNAYNRLVWIWFESVEDL